MLPLGAFIKNTTQYVYPSIANKNDKYECPDCSRDLILRQGSKRAHHFAHYKTENPCNYYTSPTESQIHKHAKLLMKQLLVSSAQIVMLRTCRYCKKVEGFEIPERDSTSNIEIEFRFEFTGTKIADVAFIENNEIVAIFEICNTHKTDKENRPEPWFEIDAFTLINIANESQSMKFDIPCIRNELCEECSEKNVCKGRGECLLDHPSDIYKFIKNTDFLCEFNCKPIKCPGIRCYVYSQKWALDENGGFCYEGRCKRVMKNFHTKLPYM
jgi:uncharacterized protein YkuJ